MTDKETNSTIGIVQTLKTDRKGIKMADQWYSSFDKEVPCKQGDQVKVDYTITQKGERTYRNWTKIEVMQSSKPLQEFQKEAREDKALTMLVSYAKDVVVATINHATASNVAIDTNKIWEESNSKIWASYKFMQEKLKETEKTAAKPEAKKEENPDY